MPNEPALDMAQLKRLAEQATQGEWELDADEKLPTRFIVNRQGEHVATGATKATATYIAATSPSTMLKILSHIATLSLELEQANTASTYFQRRLSECEQVGVERGQQIDALNRRLKDAPAP